MSNKSQQQKFFWKRTTTEDERMTCLDSKSRRVEATTSMLIILRLTAVM